MRVLRVLFVATSCAFVSTIDANCDCRPREFCPPAYGQDWVRQCRLPGGRLGACCSLSAFAEYTSGVSRPSSRYHAPPPSGGGEYNARGCVPLVLCPKAATTPAELAQRGCQLRDGSLGIFCTFDGQKLPASGMRPAAQGQLRPMPSRVSGAADAPFVLGAPTEQELTAAGEAGLQAVNAIAPTTSQLLNSDLAPNDNSPTALLFINAQSSDLEQALGRQGLQSIMAVASLQEQMVRRTKLGQGANVAGGSSGNSTGSRQLPAQVPNCIPEEPISCENSFYRTITGECNNLQRPRLGRSLTGQKRLLPNTYDDGLFAIRTRAVRGGTLPSARFVSERVLDTFSNELKHFTLSIMQFSQFVNHDLSRALMFRLDSGKGIQCCENDGKTLPPVPRHPQCIPIPIPADDPFYSQFGQRCMSLVRSMPAPLPDCIPRPARPLNEITTFLDLSNVYDSQEARMNELRAFQDGLMRKSPGELLPMLDPASMCRASICFRAGDRRVNEQSGLALMHTIFLREHNRIAKALKRAHPAWDDERLFQSARRIFGGEWQHIIYNEWLPVIIGFDYASAYGLLPLQSGFSYGYDPSIDPSVSISFGSAAFRYGHNMVRDMYDLIDADGQVFQVVNVTRTFFDPTVVAQSLVEHARTLVARRSETVDTNVAPTVHEQLFTTNFRFGLDLLSLNIQRGRDQGTPTYLQMLEACSNVQVKYWGDLNRLMDPDVVDRLRYVYDDPRDVDLFIGGLSEQRAPGAQVGPTFQCVIGQQFTDARFGDRFFYDNGGFPHSFTVAQLEEIRKSSWSRILCDTLGPEFGDDFTRVQPLGFIETLGLNQIMDCQSLAIPTVDLGVF
ncbi:peroxidase-like [Pollicipes pollicipes]|uniref:peroxidase-like n=1 Tax=Pollicipes pollicipes TaxID=41117 RepID=UPI0018853CCD|nr:peroxidase-like [Pollicipes pollicipes]